MPFQGHVDLKNPDVTFQFIEYYGLDSKILPENPIRTFFGRVVSFFIICLYLIFKIVNIELL